MQLAALVLAGAATVAGAAIEKRCTQPSNIKPGKSFDRVFTIFFENEDRSSVTSNPTFAAYAKKGIQQTNYLAASHPSQPNYIAYVSGSTNGVTSDSNVNLAAASIADRLEAAGISWGAYAEDLPSSCYTGATSGEYARKHEPFISFKSISGNSTRCAHIKPASQLSTDIQNGNVPQFTFFAPNLLNDGHDTNVSYSAAWLDNFYNQHAAFFQQTNTVLHLTYDESESYTSNNQVYSATLGGAVPATKVGTSDATSYNHYSMLKAVEQNWGLASLATGDANANPLAGYARNTTLCG